MKQLPDLQRVACVGADRDRTDQLEMHIESIRVIFCLFIKDYILHGTIADSLEMLCFSIRNEFRSTFSSMKSLIGSLFKNPAEEGCVIF